MMMKISDPTAFLNTFFDHVEKSVVPKKSYFDICGISGKELVNSNLLYYFFDENEDHNLKRIFLESLIEIYNEKSDVKQDQAIFETSFFLVREHKYIDLVICAGEEESRLKSGEADWVIILENKLFADLYNDLDGYLEKVQAKLKIGVVLSLIPTKLKTKKYVNILHAELVQRAKEKIAVSIENIDTSRLILLKEYLLNIKSLTMTENLDSLNINLAQYQKEIQNIEALRALENELRDYAIKSMMRAFQELQFNPSNQSTSTWTKHFLPDLEYWKEANGLRFWIDFSPLVKHNMLHGYLESFGEHASVGDKARKVVRMSLSILPEDVSHGENGGAAYQHTHFFHINAKLPTVKGGDDLKDMLYEVLKKAFFTSGLFDISIKQLRAAEM